MEKDIKKLDDCIEVLQGEAIPIKDAIKHYEKGLSAAEKVLATLNQSHAKIETLNQKAETLIKSCQPKA